MWKDYMHIYVEIYPHTVYECIYIEIYPHAHKYTHRKYTHIHTHKILKLLKRGRYSEWNQLPRKILKKLSFLKTDKKIHL